MKVSTRTVLVLGALLCLVLAAGASVLASGRPDGLEHVARTLGFADTATATPASGSPLAGYTVRGQSGGARSGALAGVLGLAATGALMAGLLVALRRAGRRD